MSYATVQDYLAWADVTSAPSGIGRVLDVASTRVDELLVGVVYDVDTLGRPTDPAVADVLRRATCEQALYMLESGDTTGAGGLQSQTVGRVSWTRAQGSGGSTDAQKYAPNAVSLLHVEGLTPRFTYRY